MSYYTETDRHINRKIKFELELPNYTIKSDVESSTGVGTSKFARKILFSKLQIRY